MRDASVLGGAAVAILLMLAVVVAAVALSRPSTGRFVVIQRWPDGTADRYDAVSVDLNSHDHVRIITGDGRNILLRGPVSIEEIKLAEKAP